MYKVTGQYMGGVPYVAYVPDWNYNDYQANKHNASMDGNLVDLNSLSEEYIDDEIIPDAEISRFKIVLYRSGILSGIETYMAGKNGETAIWWNNVKSISYYHSKVQEAINDLDLDIETVKNFFRQAQEIE